MFRPTRRPRHEQSRGQSTFATFGRQGTLQNGRLNPTGHSNRSLWDHDRADARLAVDDQLVRVVHREPVSHVAAAGLRIPIKRADPAGQFVSGNDQASRIVSQNRRKGFDRRVGGDAALHGRWHGCFRKRRLGPLLLPCLQITFVDEKLTFVLLQFSVEPPLATAPVLTQRFHGDFECRSLEGSALAHDDGLENARLHLARFQLNLPGCPDCRRKRCQQRKRDQRRVAADGCRRHVDEFADRLRKHGDWKRCKPV